MKAIPALLSILLAAAAPAAAQVVVSDGGTPILEQRVEATVRGQTASVTLHAVLGNPHDAPGEAMVMLPLPKGSAVSDFTMRIGDRDVQAELLDAEKARRVYEGIVRRKKDPALLELSDTAALRARVFPVPARGSVTLSFRYAHPVPREGGILRFQVPAFLRSAVRRASLRLDLESAAPLGAIYSPGHPVDVARRDPNHARVTFEAAGGPNLAVFTVYAAVGEPGVGASLAAYRDGPEEGHFMLMLSPPASDEAALPKDVVFVLDRSGSMAGEKMEQARAAALYCIDRLRPGDAFAVVDFAGSAARFDLAEASPEARQRAKDRVSRLESGGGTDLDSAVREALRLLARREGRVPVLFLITDGHPTVGETDTERILRAAREGNGASARVFTFGVGGDVDTRLLDRLAEESGGLGDVVQPGERIDDRTAQLFDRVGSPALADLKVEFKGVAVSEIEPRRLPDLFRGGEVVIAGRYSGSGACRVTLQGRAARGERTIAFDVFFPERDAADFEVARLWARRRVGALFEQARLHDRPEKELVDEIIALSKKYRVATPYTSFLILEEGEPAAQRMRVLHEMAALRSRASVGSRADALDGIHALMDCRRMREACR